MGAICGQLFGRRAVQAQYQAEGPTIQRRDRGSGELEGLGRGIMTTTFDEFVGCRTRTIHDTRDVENFSKVRHIRRRAPR